VALTEYLFGGMIPDGGMTVARRMEAMPGPSDTEVGSRSEHVVVMVVVCRDAAS